MIPNLRYAAIRRRLVLLPAAVFLALFVLPTILQAWPGPGHPLDPYEQEVVDLVNKERTSRGLKPYIVNFSLVEAAWNHSKHMAQINKLCHSGCGDGDPGQRVKATGYKAVMVGENVAVGYRTPADVMAGWMSSSGHKANILSRNYTDIGVALAYTSGGTPYWTQVFAVPAEGYATVTPPPGHGNPGLDACLGADVNGDKRVTRDDVQEVAQRAGAVAGDARYEEIYDLTRDGEINVYDTYKVMLAVGQSCLD